MTNIIKYNNKKKSREKNLERCNFLGVTCIFLCFSVFSFYFLSFSFCFSTEISFGSNVEESERFGMCQSANLQENPIVWMAVKACTRDRLKKRALNWYSTWLLQFWFKNLRYWCCLFAVLLLIQFSWCLICVRVFGFLFWIRFVRSFVCPLVGWLVGWQARFSWFFFSMDFLAICRRLPRDSYRRTRTDSM